MGLGELTSPVALYKRKGSAFWHCWIEGAATPRVNLKIPIGSTAEARRESKALAERAYFVLMGNRAADRVGMARDRPVRTFLQQRTWYLKHVTPLKKGETQERSMLKTLGSFFDAYALTAITIASVREWRATRKVKASTIRREEALLRHLLATAIPDYLATHPLEGLDPVKIAPTDMRTLSQDDERKLLAACASDEDRALIVGALDTLLRMSSIATLTRQQDHRTYLYADTKTGAVRIPISSRLRLLLDALPAGPDFFPTYAQSTDVNYRVGRMFSATCKRAGIISGSRTGGIGFHSLRHTGATRMLAAGVDVKTVMRIGGWKSLIILERYLHPTSAAAQAAVDTIAAR